jgi:SAM-dependent methyltransferase
LKRNIKTTNIICEICKNDNSKFYCSTVDYSYQTCSNKFIFNFCKNCEVIYLKNQPNYSEYGVIYNNEYVAYSDINNLKGSALFNYATYIANYFKFLNIKKNCNTIKNVLEIGPGSGQLIKIIEKKLNIKKNKITLVEPSKTNAKLFFKEGYEVSNKPFEKFYTKKKYDVIIANQLFEHLKNPNLSIKKFYKLLNPNGLLFIETPSYDCLENKIFEKKLWGGLHAPRHMYIYNKKSIINIFYKNNFRVIKIKNLLSPYTIFETFKSFLVKKKINFLIKHISIYNPFFLLLYCGLDLLQICFLFKNSNMQVLIKKYP